VFPDGKPGPFIPSIDPPDRLTLARTVFTPGNTLKPPFSGPLVGPPRGLFGAKKIDPETAFLLY